MTQLVTVRKDNGTLALVGEDFAALRGLKVLDQADLDEHHALAGSTQIVGEPGPELGELPPGTTVTPTETPEPTWPGSTTPEGPPAEGDQHTGGQQP